MIRGIAIQRKKALIPSPIDLRSVIGEHNDLLSTIQEKRDALQKIHDASEQAHAEFVFEARKRLERLDAIIAEARLIEKGDPGEPGTSVDHNEVVADVLKKVVIPKPVHGKDAVVDYQKVAKLAAQLVPKPKPQKEAKIDHESLAETVLGLIATGKKKLSVKHLGDFNEGLEQTIAPIRSLAAGFRGGGDTVAAGNGVTITNANGVKTISASGSSGFQTPTGTVNGVNTVFVFTTAPNAVVVDGGRAMQRVSADGTVNWTIAGTTITLAVAPTFDVFSVA